MCKNAGVPLENLNLNDKLGVPAEYFNNACFCILEIGIKLAHVLWRKLLPLDIENADSNLNEIAFFLLFEEDYKLAGSILDFAVNTLKKHSDEEWKRIFIVNKCIANKLRGDSASIPEILKKMDWSACSEKFNLAVQILRDDYEAAAKTMKKLGKDSEEVKESYYHEWPLFKEFRKSEDFLKAYEEIFGKPFSILKIPKKPKMKIRFENEKEQGEDFKSINN